MTITKEQTQEKLVLAYMAYVGSANSIPSLAYEELKLAFELTPQTKDMKIVWGPAAHPGVHNFFDEAFMFVVANEDNSEYTVVIRGTNPLSLQSWIFQDLQIKTQVPWPSGKAPEGAMISDGANLSLTLLKDLQPQADVPGEGTIADFLAKILDGDAEVKIGFTGHSLAGAMSPNLALWLIDAGLPLIDKADLQVWGFAGPTAGNEAFANYSNIKLDTRAHLFANTMDAVPHGWNTDSLKELRSLYDLCWNDFAFDLLLDQALTSVKDKGYTALSPLTWKDRGFNPLFPGFFGQMLYQHTVAYFELFDLQLDDLMVKAGFSFGN